VKVNENRIAPESEYFVYSPSAVARNTFFYPICTGHFIYEPHYELRRTSYDSYLLMYVQKGQFILECEGKKQTAGMGSFVLLDCYRPHAYYSDTGWESIWCHFDGQMARAYYDLTVSYLGNIFTLVDDYPVLNKMTAIYQTFAEGRPIREALLSKQLTDIWTALLMDQAERPGSGKVGRVSVWEGDSIGMENVISYINEHFTGKITIQTLAEQAMLSQYHFIRMFKSYTSFTPHEYIVNIRISAAKYMLKNTSLSVKDIGLDAGFPSESAFCTAFKKKMGITPTEYRNSMSSL